MAIQEVQVAELYKTQYGEDIHFSKIIPLKTGGLFHRKHFVIGSVCETGQTETNAQEDAHKYSKAKHFVVPVKSGKIAAQGMLFDMKSFDAYNRRYANAEGKNEVWNTCEVFLSITSGKTELAQIHSSGTGDTPYVDATDNIQIRSWIERRFPVYDFLISSGLSEDEEAGLNDNDIKKRRTLIYKFALEFFNTFVISKEEIKAEQERLNNLIKEENLRKKSEQQKIREQEKADKKAWLERRAAARVKVRMEDKDSLPKKNLMKSFLGNDIFE